MIQAREAAWVLGTVLNAEVERVLILETAPHVLRKPIFWSLRCKVLKKALG